MPGPGAKRQKPKPKKKPPFVSLTDNPISTFVIDIDNEEGWHIIINILCKHLELPGMPSVISLLLGVGRLTDLERRPYNASGIEAGPCSLCANIRPDERAVQQEFEQGENHWWYRWDLG